MNKDQIKKVRMEAATIYNVISDPLMAESLKEYGIRMAQFALSMGSEWVKCSERMPEEGVLVLFGGTGYVQVGLLAVNKFYTSVCSYRVGEDVTHWQPLPTPPSE